MRELQRDYRRKLDEIAQKDSTLKLPDNPLPSFAARVETCRKEGLKKLKASDSDHKSWLKQLHASQHERMQQRLSDRSSELSDMRAKAEVQRKEQLARDTLIGTFYRGV